ncbi:MAG: polysaccharide biosynthesis C-terminal domain-containing protein [Coriobacteriia bacterium]|nr:polysaccharide biosynthesis C-terminal domain-containing protein [Coriobacteriia bacterium]
MLKDILKGAGTDAAKYFPVRLVPALTSLVTVPVFTRLIGRADYGDFYLVSSATTFAATFATAWITGSAVRFYWPYEKQGREDDYVATTLWSSIASLAVVSALLGAGALVFAGDIPPSVARLIPVGIAGLAFNYLFNVLLQVLRASNRSTAFATLSVAGTVVATAFSVSFVAGPRWGSYGILLGVLLGHAVLIPFCLREVRKEGKLSPRHVRRDVFDEFLRYGIPMVPAAVSAWMLVMSDRYVIGFLRGTAEVGMYSVAYGLGEKVMQLVMMPAVITMAPVMVQTFEKRGQHVAQRVQTQFTRYFSMATFPLLFGLAGAARDFMGIFTGEAYRAAYPILPIVAAGVMCYGLVQIAGNGIALHKRSTIIMSNTLAAAAFNLGANLVLVPVFGYMAAAYTTLASYVALLALTWVRSRPYMSWDIPWLDLGRITAAGLAMWGAIAVTAALLPANIAVLALEAVVGIAAYVAALLGLRALRDDEREFVAELAGKAASRLGFRRATEGAGP